MKIDIVIPNFNGSHLIEKNLPDVINSLADYAGRIIIVDDGSADEDRKKLRKIVEEKKYENLILVEHEYNQGFSSAVNSGVKSSNAELIVLLNSDVRPTEGFIKPLIDKMKNDRKYFGIGCMDESLENGKIVKRGRGIGYWNKGMVLHKRGEVDNSSTFWISGGSCIVRKSIFEILGGFDTLYNPFYWEDIDLSYRAVKSGYKIAFEKTSIVEHFHEEGSIKKGFAESKVTTIAYRNQLIFIWKNITSPHLIINHFFFLPLNILSALIRFDYNFLVGFLLALVKLPDIMRKRNLQRKLFKVSDISILNHIS